MTINEPTPEKVNSRIDEHLRALAVLAEGREFQIWRYYVSHCTLLIRSPKFGNLKENVDIVIQGVSYISARTSYEHFLFELGTESDRDQMATRLSRSLTKKERVFCLRGDGWRDHIVALGAYPSVNSVSPFSTPNLPMFEMYVAKS